MWASFDALLADPSSYPVWVDLLEEMKSTLDEAAGPSRTLSFLAAKV